MPRIALFFLTATVLLGADNPWVKVQELKSRTELRIYKKGAATPLMATFDDATADRLLIVLKNEQVSIAKEDIDRLDARPSVKTKRTVTKTTSVTTTNPDYTPRPPDGVQVPTESYNTGLSISGTTKPDFETVYRRPAPEPKAAAPKN